jgi:hypothetical protein
VAQFIYDLVNSQYFGILLLIWIAVDVIWIGRWQALFIRVGKLIGKPWIFAIDKNPKDPPLYPREILEQLAQRKSNTSGDQQEGPLNKFATSQMNQVFNPEHPMRTAGYVFFLVLFVFFLLADAISVAQTLNIMGITFGDLPPIFDRFDLAVLGGAILAAVVGIWVFVEVLGNSDFIDTAQMNDSQRGFLKVLSLFIAIFSVIVMIAFAIERLIALGILETNPTVGIILASILYGLVPINSSLAAAICFSAATRGFIVLLFLLTYLIIGILPVLVFIVDIAWRIIHILLDIILWALFTPFMIIPFGVYKIITMVNPSPSKP